MNQFKRFLATVLVALYSLSVCVGVASATMIELQAQEDSNAYAALQEQAVYVVGYTPDHSPFSYQTEDGDAQGIAIEMMNYMAGIAGIQVEYVSLDDLSDAAEIDINLSVLNADQREANSIKSIPYYQFQLMLVSKTEEISLANTTVGHLGYSAFDNKMVESGLLGCDATTYPNFDALQAAFDTGAIDYMLDTSLVVQEVSGLEVYSVATGMTLDVMLKFNNAMSQDKIDAFNTLITSLDEQSINTIVLNAALLVGTQEFSVSNFFAAHVLQILLAIVCIIGVIIAIILVANINKRKALETMLNVDDLTGLMTKHKFMLEVRKILSKAKPADTWYLISFDIDNFKYINEIHGYEKGTQTIQAFAHTLQETFVGATCIARPFADNFILFTKVPPRNGNICGMEICTKCMDHCLGGILGNDYRLITSAGIYQVVDKTLSLSYMIDCANIARHQGKGTYKRTEWVFTKEIEEELKVKNEIISSMEKALLEKEFKIYYQPKINFQTEKFVGAEALVRWFRSDGRQFNPSEFITLFEQNGFIARLDYYVLAEVSAFLVAHPTLCKVSVNVSGNTFLEPDIIERIVDITEQYGIAHPRLEIEITESAIVNEFEIIRHHIDELKALGFTISMDDFGAGLSSLNRLKDISIDVLKIDKEFLGIDTLSKKGESIIASIIDMTKKIEVETVAEGVETQQQVALLRNLTCDTAQGFYYARPLPEDDFLDFVQTHQ